MTQQQLFDISETHDVQKELGNVIGYVADHSVYVNGRKIDIHKSQKIRQHSPTGFSWGYAGSGPSQLALAILLEITTEQRAKLFYQEFKWEIISKLKSNEDFCISIDLINELLTKYEYCSQ